WRQKSVLPNPTKSGISGSSRLLPAATSEESFHFHPSSFSSFLLFSWPNLIKERKMGAPAGLRDSIFPCVPIPLGSLNACTWNLFSQQPLTCESLAFFVAFCFSQVLKALDSFYSNVEAVGLFPLLCLPTFEPKKMGLSPEAPKRPETSISRPINGPHGNSLPSIPQPTQASSGHLSGLGPLKLAVRLSVK
ncbi:unnamed protein product, partial [Prunus brigantina]